MGLLAIFFLGVFAIIIIAKLAAKMRPEEEKRLFIEDGGYQKPTKKRQSDEEELDEDNPKETLEALITLLTRKQILNPDELLLEIAAQRKNKVSPK